MTKAIRFVGVYQNVREIHLETGDLIRWEHLSTEAPLYLPYGSRVEVFIQYEERDYLRGTNGIVWATYHLGQAETIRAALLAQSIGCEVQENVLPGARLYLLHIPEPRDVEAAADFIWRDRGGLRLKPDWHYLLGSENESFTKWVKGI